MAAFGAPRVAEDDAIRAVRAAVAIVEAVRVLAVTLAGEGSSGVGSLTANRLAVRVAVNTGEVVVSADQSDVVGDPANVAARLQQEAGDGVVLIGESTRRLVSEAVTLVPAGVFALRGRSETVAAYRVVSLERPAGAAAVAFVGRDEEMRRLSAVYEAAVAVPAARLAVVLGSAGLGKSRLLAEFGRRRGAGATVLTARCDASGGATFAPLARAVRDLLHLDPAAGGDAARAAIEGAMPGDGPSAEGFGPQADAERGRVAGGIAALLAGAPGPPEETFFVVRRFLARLGAAAPASPAASQGMRPVVLAIEDLQWAEPLLLDLVEHLVQWGAGAPLLVLAAARPDLREASARRSPALLTPDFVVEDHRPIGAGALSRDELIAILRAMGELRPDAVLLDHVLAMHEGGNLFVAHWAGDEAAGQFEIPLVGVETAAADGRMQRSDLYAPDQLAEAWARFAALGASGAVEDTKR